MGQPKFSIEHVHLAARTRPRLGRRATLPGRVGDRGQSNKDYGNSSGTGCGVASLILGGAAVESQA
jgi:hypothetical protein